MGKDEFKPLVEKYALLKTLAPDFIPHFDGLRGFYSDSAYSEKDV